jgi:chromosome segregation ATPase
MESWKTLCRDTEQDIITATEKRLEDYGRLHSEAVKQLNSLADDASRLENELLLSMQESVAKVKDEFSAFEKESGVSMENTAAAFNSQIQTLKKEIEEMDKELNGLRQQAYDNVSEKLTILEKDFTAELGKRASEIGRQIADWQAGLQERLENSAGKVTGDWQKAEERITLEQRKNVAALGEKITADLERLKQEAAAFELGIREEMHNVDETRSAFAEQIKKDLTEIRVTAENEVKAQAGQHQISMQETLRLNQRELEKEIEEITEHSKNAYAALDETAVKTQKSFDEWQISYNTKMREMDAALDETTVKTQKSFDEWQSSYKAKMNEMDAFLENLRRGSREAAAENDERISVFRKSLEDIRKELGVQKKIFDKTGELKQDLEHRIEEINADLDRLNQRKNEITQLENQFTHIKRLEDEIQRKMTSFLSEKHRIEVMEKDFERLIKTSKSVEEKLVQVETSDDILSEAQVRIRKLEDSLKETEEKYQRIERKNEVLEETNEGIDRNFKALQKTEAAVENAEKIINDLSDQFDNLRSSIETLAAENEKATDAIDKIDTLNESLSQIEKRIAEMNVAREWLADRETEFKKLDKETRNQLKLTKTIIDRKSGKTAEDDKGAVSPRDRDNVIRLKNQGWTVEEIADSMNMSIGAVELILEIGSRD